MIKCMIVDDEPLSIKVVQKYLAELPQLTLVASYTNAIEAITFLQKERVDVLFLDINMPKLSGISLLKTLSHPPLVIFITAYPQYAVEGFELEALDYLLKPFSFERFVKAIGRVEKKLSGPSSQEQSTSYLFIKSDKKHFKIDFEKIICLQAYGDYVKVHTDEKVLLVKERLSVLEKELPARLFQRIHRSHIIALSALRFIEGNQAQVNTIKLPIAATYRDELMLRLKKS